ncbi:MAG: c-type cytochrome [Acidobacteriaceae bacterium]|nr:c-type cytochrome [Acidobacteriaceae bacterium]
MQAAPGEGRRIDMIQRVLAIAGSAIFCMTLAAGFSAGQKGKGDAAKGKEAFEQCAICHNVDSPEKKMGPSLQGLFKRKTMVNGKPVNDANVLAQINNGGNGMPAYADTLNADDKANLLAYLHTL